MERIFLLIISIALFTACDIVSLEENVAPEDITTPDKNTIDIGSQDIPLDSVVQSLYLHGENAKVWRAESFVIEGMGGLTSEQDCRLDDVITFNADGTLFYESGALSCGGEEGEAIDRIGTFVFDNSTSEMLALDVANVTGFENQNFSGRIWTLEENLLVISTAYKSDIFGTFTVTGRYVSE